MISLTLPSFAKINWHLEVFGRRPDGFHELITVFQMIDLADELRFEAASDGIVIESEGYSIPLGDNNLVSRAVELLKRETGFGGGVRVFIKKLIPVSAGLGGGSGNAAITLLAVNSLFKLGLSLEELARLGAQLGSDVPFFLGGGLSVGIGRGEQITPVEVNSEQIELLLIFPRVAISAAEAYALLDEQRPAAPQLTREGLDTTIRRFREVIEGRNWTDLWNDLEQPILHRYPVLRVLKWEMLKAGCKFVMLSGSGSSMFGVGESTALKNAAGHCREQDLGEVLRCCTISRKQYRRILAKSGLQLSKDQC